MSASTATVLLMFTYGLLAAGSYVAFRRLPRSFRIKLYLWLVATGLIGLTVMAITEALDAPIALLGAAALGFSQLFALGARIWQMQMNILGDPRWREERSLPQYEGRTRRYWELRLRWSPWHIVRYHRLAWADAESPAREYRERQPRGFNL